MSAIHARHLVSSTTQRRPDGGAILHRGGADLHFVFARVFAGRRVDHQGHVIVLHQVDDVRALAAGEFREDFNFDAGLGDDAAGAAGGVEGKAEVGVERWRCGRRWGGPL